MTTGPLAGANGQLRKTGASLLNDLFHSYGHKDGFIYDADELKRVVYEAGLLAPLGDCVVEAAAFQRSARLPEIAAKLDDPMKAHESLYADVVCGAARTSTRAVPAAPESYDLHGYVEL